MKIKIGTSAVPHYQDGAFKINLPLKNSGNISFFGIGGNSKVDILVSQYAEPQEDIYADKDRDQFFGSSLGMIGSSYTKAIGKRSFTRFTLSTSVDEAHSYHRLVYRDSLFKIDSLVDKLHYRFVSNKTSFAWSLNSKISNRFNTKIGVYADYVSFNLNDSIYNENSFLWEGRLEYTGGTTLIQPYIQGKYRFSESVSLNAGIHTQYLFLNNSWTIEPRASLKWKISSSHSLSLGYGLHSKTSPYYIYFQQFPNGAGETEQLNRGLGFIRAHHVVLEYDLLLGSNARIKTEAYYQKLFNVPVNLYPSAYSVLNEGSSFNRFFPLALENKGTGRNAGVEFTFEKFFSKSYFFLLTASVYDSKYRGSDGILRNTDFNGRFATNVLAGKEIPLDSKKKTLLTTGGKITVAGGRRYTPADVGASALAGELVETDSLKNSKQFRNYFRFDIKLGLKINTSKKLSHEIAIDLINVLDTKNILALSYAPDPRNPFANPLREEYQLGRLPLFYYKLDF